MLYFATASMAVPVAEPLITALPNSDMAAVHFFTFFPLRNACPDRSQLRLGPVRDCLSQCCCCCWDALVRADSRMDLSKGQGLSL